MIWEVQDCPALTAFPSYFFFGGSTGFGSFGDRVAETASNVGSSIRDTASNIGSTIKDTFTGGGEDDVGNFGRVGDVLGGIGDDLGITDYGTNDTVYGTGPVEPVETTILPDPVTTVTAPLLMKQIKAQKHFKNFMMKRWLLVKKCFFMGVLIIQ